MPNCMEQVYSEEYYDFLIPYGVEAEVPSTPGCVQRIAEDYDIFFYPREGLPPLSIGNYTYTAIPKCYALLDTTALDASGITRLQNHQSHFNYFSSIFFQKSIIFIMKGKTKRLFG